MAPPAQVSLTTVFTVCFGVMSVVAVVFFLLKTKVALTLALASAMAAVAMNHAVDALERRGLRRSWAIVAVMDGVTALVVGRGLLLVPPIVTQGRALAAEMPALWEKLQHASWFERLDARLHVQEQLRESGPAAAGAVSPLLSAIGSVVTALGGLLAFLFLAVFMLVFGRDLAKALFAELKPAGRERTSAWRARSTAPWVATSAACSGSAPSTRSRRRSSWSSSGCPSSFRSAS